MMDSLYRILAILAKEVGQLARDRLTFGMTVGIPLMQILLFGYAINMDVRHLITTPIRNAELMVGKIVPYIVIGLVQVTIIVIVSRLLFSVPIRGSVVELYLASARFIAASLGLGLMISTYAKTQFQAMQLTFPYSCRNCCCLDSCFPLKGCPFGPSESPW